MGRPREAQKNVKKKAKRTMMEKRQASREKRGQADSKIWGAPPVSNQQ